MTFIIYLVAYLLIGLVVGACLENLYIIFDITKSVSVARWVITAPLWPMFVLILAHSFHKYLTTTKGDTND